MYTDFPDLYPKSTSVQRSTGDTISTVAYWGKPRVSTIAVGLSPPGSNGQEIDQVAITSVLFAVNRQELTFRIDEALAIWRKPSRVAI